MRIAQTRRLLRGQTKTPITKALDLGNGAEIGNPLETWTLQPERLDAVTPLMQRITVLTIIIRSTKRQRDLVVDLERLASSYFLMTETTHATMGQKDALSAGRASSNGGASSPSPSRGVLVGERSGFRSISGRFLACFGPFGNRSNLRNIVL